jgi:hypothetical protein
VEKIEIVRRRPGRLTGTTHTQAVEYVQITISELLDAAVRPIRRIAPITSRAAVNFAAMAWRGDYCTLVLRAKSQPIALDRSIGYILPQSALLGPDGRGPVDSDLEEAAPSSERSDTPRTPVPATKSARELVVHTGRVQASRLRAAGKVAAAAHPSGEWPERQAQALDALRSLAAFLAMHPTDPVAESIAHSLSKR